jgi:hypothetical protein
MEIEAIEALQMEEQAKAAEQAVIRKAKAALRVSAEVEASRRAAERAANEAAMKAVRDRETWRRAAFQSWVDSLGLFIKACAYAATPSAHRLKPRCTSLVEVHYPEPSVDFLFWDNPTDNPKEQTRINPSFTSWQGRILNAPDNVEYDGFYRLSHKPITQAANFSEEIYTKAIRIVVADIGPTMIRARDQDRARVPVAIMRLKRFVEDMRVIEFHRTRDGHQPSPHAVACELCRRTDARTPLTDRCPTCGLHIHDACWLEVKSEWEASASSKVKAPSNDAAASILSVWSDESHVSCRLCLAWRSQLLPPSSCVDSNGV